VPFLPRHEGDTRHHYHDALKVLFETAVQSPQNALLLPFIADPPTTTLQRLKGLTTGTLPTLIDAGSNFAGTAIDEDNLISQLRNASKRVVHLGDDTWHALFPEHFEPELTKPYDSFNVWDLHTLDNGVTDHLFPLLQGENVTKWDVLIGHYLGVDHAGHRYGPDHPAMNAKLVQMDDVFRRAIETLDEDTLLVVMGDHGMDAKGDHGGESDDEVEAALWMYSKRAFFGREKHENPYPPPTAKQNAVAQIDLVPTLALLLGLPIPFNNLGTPILQAFLGPAGKGYENVARVSRLAAAQMARHIREYSLVRDIQAAFAVPTQIWDVANRMWSAKDPNRTDLQKWQEVAVAFRAYQSETIAVCREMWARFDSGRMVSGIAVLVLTLGVLVLYARGISALRLALSPGFVKRGGIGLIVGAATGAAAGSLIPGLSFSHATALLASLGAISGLLNVFYKARASIRFPRPTRVWSWASLIFTLALSAGFAANSFTIWEDEIHLFFLSTLGILFFLASMRLDSLLDRTWACYHSAVFTILTRLASLSRLCREEQMPYCISTYYASSTSSTSAWWQLLIPFIVAFALPGIVKQYYINTRSYHHSAQLWLGVAFRAGLALAASYWTLDAIDDRELFGPGASTTLKTVKVMIAQVTLGVALPVGYSVFAWAAPFMQVLTAPLNASTPPTLNSRDTAFLSQDGQSRIQILGYGNAHGARYMLLPTMYALAIILLQKPMGAGAIAILLWQILSLLEVIAANNLQDSAVGPVTLGLLGGFHFFKTGHQASLASIQWDAAFIPLKTIMYPWSPLFILLNTFGAQILVAIAVPGLILWKRDPTRKNLLSDVAKAVATFLAFYATEALATAVWAGHLRRHLMLYRVFSPRFMMGALVCVVVDLAAIFIGIGGVRWSFLSVGEVFGVYG
jgi:phosphatidylinositol glycan class O